MDTAMDKYQVGAVASLFSCDKQSNRKEKKRKNSEKLQELFKVTPAKKKKKEDPSLKKVQDDFSKCTSKEGNTKEKVLKTAGYCPPPGIVHESLQKNVHESLQKKIPKNEHKFAKKEDGETEVPQLDRKQQRENRRKKVKDKKKDTLKYPRTVFVGNLPLTCTRKKLGRVFKKYGEIENVRFRCPPPADPRIPKKVVALKKDFHENRNNNVAFICYKDPENAAKACKMNGKEFMGLHLRVDISSNDKKHDNNKSIFIGNIAFDIEEEIIREHFGDCGKIDNVRIVRDSKSGLGKGFGYVQFRKKESVSLALSINDTELKGRKVRVMRCTDQQKKTDSDEKDRRKAKKEKRKSKTAGDNDSKPSKSNKESASSAHKLKSVPKYSDNSKLKYNPVPGQERRNKLIQRRKEKKKKVKKFRNKIIAKKLGFGSMKSDSIMKSVRKKPKHYKSTKTGNLS